MQDFVKKVVPIEGDTKKYLLSLNRDDFTRTSMNKLFSKKYDSKTDKLIAPILYPESPLTLEAKTLLNQKNKIETTAGLYVFNKICLEGYFGDKIPYHNETISDGANNINNAIVQKIAAGEIDNKVFIKYLEKLVWLCYLTKLFFPNFSTGLIIPNQKILKERDRLVEKYKDIIEAGDHIKFLDLVEKPLLKMAEEILKNDPAFNVYRSGLKPKLDNAYKEMNIMVGVVQNPTDGKYIIITKSLAEGADISKYHAYANSAIIASYSRSEKTKEGGTFVKRIASALQHIKINPKKGHDCGTLLLKKTLITDYNYQSFLFSYYKEKLTDKELKLIDQKILKSLIGKEIFLRTVLFCKDLDFCNMCAGELPFIKGTYNMGTMLSIVGSQYQTIAMKKMHDTSMNIVKVDPNKYLRYKGD